MSAETKASKEMMKVAMKDMITAALMVASTVERKVDWMVAMKVATAKQKADTWVQSMVESKDAKMAV